MEGNLASYFQLQTNSEKFDRGCDENHMSSEKHVIHHFPEEDGISSDYSVDSYGLLDPDGTDIRCENAIYYEGGVDDVNDSNDSCCDEPSTNSSSDEILEDQIEMMEHIRQVSMRSTEVKDELRKVRKAFKKDVGDENIWQVVASSGDESDNDRAKIAFRADRNKEHGRSIKTRLKKSPPKLDRNRGGISHRRIENNEEDDYHVELRKDKMSIRGKLSESSTAAPEESLEVSCTRKKERRNPSLPTRTKTNAHLEAGRVVHEGLAHAPLLLAHLSPRKVQRSHAAARPGSCCTSRPVEGTRPSTRRRCS